MVLVPVRPLVEHAVDESAKGSAAFVFMHLRSMIRIGCLDATGASSRTSLDRRLSKEENMSGQKRLGNQLASRLPRGSWRRKRKKNSQEAKEEKACRKLFLQSNPVLYLFLSFRQIPKFTVKYKTVENVSKTRLYFPPVDLIRRFTSLTCLQKCKCRNCVGMHENACIVSYTNFRSYFYPSFSFDCLFYRVIFLTTSVLLAKERGEEEYRA